MKTLIITPKNSRARQFGKTSTDILTIHEIAYGGLDFNEKYGTIIFCRDWSAGEEVTVNTLVCGMEKLKSASASSCVHLYI